MSSTRKTAVVAGVFFVVAAVAAIAAKLLWIPVLGDAESVLGAGDDGRVLAGVVVEFLTAVAVVGTGVALYPVIKRQSGGIAFGYAAGRALEAATILVGLAAMLAIVSLRQDAAGGADDAALAPAGDALVALHDAMFLLGPGLIIGINTVLLAWLMYRSGLVPRWIAVVGLVGGPLVLLSSTAVLFGAYEQVSATAGLFAFPVFLWEMSLAAYLIGKGFKSAPVETPPVRPQEELVPA